MRRVGLQRVGLALLAAVASFACAANSARAREAAPECRSAVCASASAHPPAASPAPAHPQSTQRASRDFAISNKAVAEHPFLTDMYADDYFPRPLVEKGEAILLRLCERIEREQPANTAALYALTHAATEEFNRLDEEFAANGSEIEIVAREAIAKDFAWIANAYGFDADLEELIAPRDW